MQQQSCLQNLSYAQVGDPEAEAWRHDGDEEDRDGGGARDVALVVPWQASRVQVGFIVLGKLKDGIVQECTQAYFCTELNVDLPREKAQMVTPVRKWK